LTWSEADRGKQSYHSSFVISKTAVAEGEKEKSQAAQMPVASFSVSGRDEGRHTVAPNDK
jgi:hypothetical protein